jgi:hypothetical protein
MTTIAVGFRGSKWPAIYAYPRRFNSTVLGQPFLQHLDEVRGEPAVAHNESDSDDDSDTASSYSTDEEIDDDSSEPPRKREGEPLIGHDGQGFFDLECGLRHGVTTTRRTGRSSRQDAGDRTLHPMRVFTSEIHGLQQNRLHLDDEEVISAYCEHESAAIPCGPAIKEPLIAIVDRRMASETSLANDGGVLSRPQRGGLTAAQLLEETSDSAGGRTLM